MKLLIIFLGCFTLCISLTFSQQTDTSEVWQLEQKATELYETFKFDSAAHCYFQVAEIYTQQEEWVNSVKYYRLTANSFNKAVKLDTATYFAQKAFDIANNYFIENIKNEKFEKAEVYLTFGNIFEKSGKHALALQNYENALEIVIKTDSLEMLIIAKIWNRIGSSYRYLGQYEKTIEFCGKSLETMQKLLGNDHIDLVNNLRTLGITYGMKGEYDEALKNFHKSLQIRIQEHGEQHHSVINSYRNMAIVYSLMGNYNKALEYYQINLQKSIQTLGKDHPSIGHTYNNIGVLYKNKRDYDKAIGNYQKALHIYTLTLNEKHPLLISTYRNIGIIYGIKKDYKKAFEYYQNALQISIQAFGEQHPKIAECYSDFGSTHYSMGEYYKSLEYEQKALQMYIQIFGKYHPYIAQSYNKIGLIYDKKGNYDKAIEQYQNALMANLINFNDTNIYNNSDSFNALSKKQLFETLNYKARSFHQLYQNQDHTINDLQASLSTYDLAFKLIQEMRNDYNHESTQLLLSEETKSIYTEAILVAIELDKEDTKKNVFKFMEKSKSATLSAYLNNMDLKQYSNIADSLLQKEKDNAINRREYEIKIQQLRTQKNGYDTLLVQKYQNKLFNYSRQYDSLMKVMESNYPDYFTLKYKQETAKTVDIQNNLDNNTALINYFIGDTSLFICSITKEEYKIKTVKIDSLFNEKIIDYYIDIKSDFTEKELKNSSYFYNYLIEPIEENLKNKDNLIIIPDGNLYYIPFETLCNDDNYSEDLSALNYLIKDYSITYNHTATLWLNSKEKEQFQSATQDNFIGFAPVFDPKINNGFIVSNEWIKDTTNTELASRSISNDFNHFNSLPYSENEVESIVKLFSKKRKEAKGFFYKEANEENFKHNIQNFKYIHIASHSFTNDLYPNLSGIAFSQPDTSDFYNEDGILYAGETYNLNLPKADLITLSSCKSGLGKLIQGEGFLSLSRGFLYSGTPNIIFSLWNVKDEPTKDLMIDFYKQVLRGTDYASALREAKIQLINNPKTASPKYWGAWILVGR